MSLKLCQKCKALYTDYNFKQSIICTNCLEENWNKLIDLIEKEEKEVKQIDNI